MPNTVYVTYTPDPLAQAHERMAEATAHQLLSVLDAIAAGQSVGIYAQSETVREALARRAA